MELYKNTDALVQRPREADSEGLRWEPGCVCVCVCVLEKVTSGLFLIHKSFENPGYGLTLLAYFVFFCGSEVIVN